jgi:hypothetical protein
MKACHCRSGTDVGRLVRRIDLFHKLPSEIIPDLAPQSKDFWSHLEHLDHHWPSSRRETVHHVNVLALLSFNYVMVLTVRQSSTSSTIVRCAPPILGLRSAFQSFFHFHRGSNNLPKPSPPVYAQAQNANTTQYLRKTSDSNQMVNLEDSTLGEEDSGFHIGDISVARGTLDSMDDVNKEATNQEHLHIASDNNLEDDTLGEEGSCLHIGDIGGGTAADSVDDDDEEATAQEHLHITPGNNQMSNHEEDTLGEEISCFHIGEIVTGKTLYSNDESVASLTAAAAPSAANNRSDDKKKWIIIGALVIATSLTVAIGGVIIAGLGKKEKMGISGASFDDTESEVPWWACLTKESCVDQAKLLGYADKDIRYGDYSSNQLYGCFNNESEGVIYWGIGGSDAQNFSTEFSGNHARVWCCGVKPNPNKGIGNDCNSAIVQPPLSSSPSSSSSSITKTAGPSE